jgi:DNA modification methylase
MTTTTNAPHGDSDPARKGGTAASIVTQGNAADLYLPDETVDLIVTSPPYFGLRSYQDGGEHYAGQIGDEATPAEYLDALIACTAEWIRVLKPGGSIFVNLGDSYSSGGRKTRAPDSSDRRRGFAEDKRPQDGFRPKTLIGLPWRYAIRCIDKLGLILRAEIVWAKPNGLPESVTDRVRRSHEQVFHFVKQPRYYAAVDEVRESHTMRPQRRPSGRPEDLTPRAGQLRQSWSTAQRDEVGVDGHPLCKLPGSVWSIPTAPLTVPADLGVDHFAAYPPELVRRIVLGWSPREVCTACGEGRRPVIEGTPMVVKPSARRLVAQASGNAQRTSTSGTVLAAATRTITGYACACPDDTAPSTPGVILDPFMGTGTTVLVADVLGRVGIGVDLSADYCRLARWRTTDPAERRRAAADVGDPTATRLPDLPDPAQALF